MVDENTSLITPPPGDDFLSPDVDGVWPKPEEESPKFNWGFFFVALLGVFIAFCDDSFVISTHEEIASSFNQLSISYWLVTAFNLGWAVSLPIYGRLYDVYGGKNTLLTAYFLCAVGCIITGTAVSMQTAVLGRLIAGIGASGMTDLISVLIVEMAPLRQVAILRMYIGAVTMSGVGTGAPLGGLITSLVGWRWSFLGQAPILLACLVMVAIKLPKHTSEEAQLRPAEDGDGPEERSMDFLGIAFLGIAVASFILICSAFTDESWVTQIKWELLTALILFGALFVANEAFWAKDPLMPLKLAATNGIGLAWLTQVLLNIAIFSVSQLSTNMGEFFVRTEYCSTSKVGLYMIPGSIGLIIGQIIGGQYIKRSGRYKFFSILCLGLCLLGFLFVMLRWPRGPSHWELLYTFFLSIGASGVFAAQFVGLSASAPQGTSATAVTVYYMSQQLGMVGGTTLASTISRGVFRRGLLRNFDKGTEELQVINKVLRNTRFAQALPDHAQHIIRSTYLESFRTVPIISLCSVVLALPLLAFQPEPALI